MKATRYAWSIAVLSLIAAAALTTSAAAQMHGGQNDDDAIRQVVQRAYIEGLHMNAGHDQVRAGFHPEFVMFVRSDDEVHRVTIEEWISRLPPEGTVPSRQATADIQVLSREGNAAAVRAEVSFDGEHVYTDFFLLYDVEGSWRIVGKAFQSHR